MSHVLASWSDANQRALVAALARVRALIDAYAGALPGGAADEPSEAEGPEALGTPPALDRLVEVFGLTPFERDVLLLCAGVELDAEFAESVAKARRGDARPTFGLALSILPEAHWSALTPSASLRHWRLLNVRTEGRLTDSPIQIDERVLHYLAGVQHLDENLVGFMYPVLAGPLAPSQVKTAREMVRVWEQGGGGELPATLLSGSEVAEKRAVAAVACASVGLRLYRLPAELIPSAAHELDALVRLWTRESVLSHAALLIDADDLERADASRTALLRRFVEEVGGPIIVSARERLPVDHRPTVAFEVGRPTRAEQRTLWADVLGDLATSLNGHVDRVTDQFDLSASAIRAASLRVSADDPLPVEEALWNACRVQARQDLEGLARCIEPRASWDDLVLPEAQLRTLHAVVAHVRHRLQVHESWGFGARSGRGLGITALFSGHSGTGKTLAAEVIAHALGLDLYHIDLSTVVSKYIGETETNLRRVFDAAEAGGAVLLFDEADALFGKRSEVRDSRDRYANLEVSYLLQRMEAFRGLAVLTTNLEKSLDTAFERRLRFRVAFPFPDAAQREAIWRRAFPRQTPVDGLDAAALARLNATGGTIRSVALHAAFLAAAAEEPVRMTHVRDAARDVYAQLEKPLSEREIAGWA